MKKILSSLCFFIFAFFLFYLCAGFIHNSFDCTIWDKSTRAIVVIFSILFSILFSIIERLNLRFK